MGIEELRHATVPATPEAKLALLCPYLREVLDVVATVKLPEGCSIIIAADGDVCLDRPDGQWIGFWGRCGGGEPRPWLPQRGSLYRPHAPSWADLQHAVDHYAQVAP